MPHVLGHWGKIFEPFASAPDPETFDDFFDRYFPVTEFPRFGDYIRNGDPRFPGWRTPLERWKWIASINESVRVWASTDHEEHELPPWAEAGWKREGICSVCGNLFPVTRKDRKTCSDKCSNINRQREWRKKKESGVTKLYDAARKRKQPNQGKGRKAL